MFNAAVLALFLSSLALAQQKSGKEITITGEVIETQCYVTGLTGPGKGAAHKDCAIRSAKAGIPLAILEDKTNTVYLTGQTKKAQSGTSELLVPFVAEKVKVTGRLFEKGGLKFLLINKVNKVGEDEKKDTKKEEKK
jgi:hypothetical protein